MPTLIGVEVTHCPQRRWKLGQPTPPGRGASGWQFGAMWLYAATGSGLSANVGRTIATSHEDASKLLALLFPKRLVCGSRQAHAHSPHMVYFPSHNDYAAARLRP